MENNVIKIGRKTAGIIFLLAGILIIVGMYNPMISFKVICSLWPIILISLGLEILYYSFKKDVDTKIEFKTIIFLIIIIGMCIFAYICNEVLALLQDEAIVEILRRI